jgi:hypothetical protein
MMSPTILVSILFLNKHLSVLGSLARTALKIVSTYIVFDESEETISI